MADKEWPQGADPAETLQGGDIIGVYQPGATGGSLNRQTTVEGVALTPVGKRTLTSGRFDSQELVSGALSVSGWYTIAECEDTGGATGCILFGHDFSGGGSLGCEVAISASSSAKTHINTTIKLTKSSANFAGVVNQITSWRLAKSDSVIDAGFKLQAFLDPATARTFEFAIHQNKARVSFKGFFLVTPFLDNTPTLPDGVTAGTFLEAGEELLLGNSSNVFLQDLILRRIDNDTAFVTVLWPEIPKQGTGITITIPSTFLRFKDGTGANANITGAHTTSNFTIYGTKKVQFQINEVNAFVALDSNIPAFAHVAGTGGKLTIT